MAYAGVGGPHGRLSSRQGQTAASSSYYSSRTGTGAEWGRRGDEYGEDEFGDDEMADVDGETAEGGEMSLLEQEVLAEYARLVQNLNELSDTLASFTAPADEIEARFAGLDMRARLGELGGTASTAVPPAHSAPAILDKLRALDRKCAIVFTALKSSVYRIVLQQEMMGDEDDEAGGDGYGGGYSGGEGESGLQGQGEFESPFYGRGAEQAGGDDPSGDLFAPRVRGGVGRGR